MEFFISDTHFGHSNILKFCQRPFLDVQDMDEKLIKNWNSIVSEKDIVYHLGDFSWRNPELYREQLNGKIVLIKGGHDYRWNAKLFSNFVETCDSKTICLRKQVIVLSHFCYRVWNKSHYGSWHLYGHSHGKLEPIGKSWDVGVDVNNFKPLSMDEIVDIMKNRPDNPNLIRKEKSEFSKEN